MSQMTILAKVQPTIGMSDLEADYTGILEPGPVFKVFMLAAHTRSCTGRAHLCEINEPHYY